MKLTKCVFALLVLTATVSLTACGGNDDEGGSTYVRSVANYSGRIEKASTDRDYDYLSGWFQFLENGTFEYKGTAYGKYNGDGCVTSASGIYTGDPTKEGIVTLSVTSEGKYENGTKNEATALAVPTTATCEITKAGGIFLVMNATYPSEAQGDMLVIASPSADYSVINGKTYKSEDGNYSISFTASKDIYWSYTASLTAPTVTTAYDNTNYKYTLTEGDSEKTTTKATSSSSPRVSINALTTTTAGIELSVTAEGTISEKKVTYIFTISENASTMTLNEINYTPNSYSSAVTIEKNITLSPEQQ